MISEKELLECVVCLHDTVKDILPQIGGIALQDYGKLNRGMILAEKILKSPNQTDAAAQKAVVKIIQHMREQEARWEAFGESTRNSKPQN